MCETSHRKESHVAPASCQCVRRPAPRRTGRTGAAAAGASGAEPLWQAAKAPLQAAVALLQAVCCRMLLRWEAARSRCCRRLLRCCRGRCCDGKWRRVVGRRRRGIVGVPAAADRAGRTRAGAGQAAFQGTVAGRCCSVAGCCCIAAGSCCTLLKVAVARCVRPMLHCSRSLLHPLQAAVVHGCRPLMQTG